MGVGSVGVMISKLVIDQVCGVEDAEGDAEEAAVDT